ncbi:MAG: hydrogenase maturation factor [Lachnospiraceae bacterium]|nr:hydrogenase maturation factor [Lachnospiraceae bacterium]
MKIGKVSESVLKRSVLKNIRSKNTEIISGAGVGADCAIFAPSGSVKYASCVQEARLSCDGQAEEYLLSKEADELSTPAVTIGELIQKAANNLAAAGAGITAIQTVFLLPTDFEEPQLKKLMIQAEEKARELQIQIAGGQTRITETVSAPQAIVTAHGKLWGDTLSGIKPGQDIVVTKWIGLEGTAMLAHRYKEGLLTRYPEYLVEEAAGFGRYLSVIPEAATAVKSGVCAMHDASEGGIFAALWEIAEAAGVGLTIDLKKLPLRQETVEVCEYCDVNPYELKAGGSMVMTTEDGPGLVAALEAARIPACMVGKVTEGKGRILLNEEEVRYMDRPRTDEIYR